MTKIFSSILIIFTLFTYICSFLPAYSAQKEETMSKIENSIYGFEYTNDNEKNRVERLEKTIYGKVFNGDLNKRLQKLSQDISADVIGLEIPPVEDTFLQENKEDAIADSTVDYPIVDEIEKRLFNQTYKNRDFHTRIVTIERKLFGKIYDVEDYSTRMDRIKSEVMPEKFAQESFSNDKSYYYDDNAISSEELAGSQFSRFNMPFGQKNYTRPYANYGDNFMGGASPIQSTGNLNNELSQLEYEMFGTEFSNEDTATRVKRLNSVQKAQKSSAKYDSNKFNQRMSTVMEIGAMILMILAMVL